MNKKSLETKQAWLERVIDEQIRTHEARLPERATKWQFWCALSRSIIQYIAEDWQTSRLKYRENRQQHYFSAEFLVGRSTLNNLINLDLYDAAKEALKSYGHDINEILEEEEDAALGNGGLGRLAACFLDSAATLNYPMTGYGILYRYGLFKQRFENGFQVESPDAWMEEDYPFIVRREDERILVEYDDLSVYAVPYDLPITAYGQDQVNTLRLWEAEPAEEFDYNLFNTQRFDDAVREKNRVEDICRVLYPNDTSYDGKVLRVRQQYFFVSASLQDVINRYIEVHGDDLSKFHEWNSIQLNDTHPAVAIPELIRLLMKNFNMTFEDAWQVSLKTFAYTNHTTLQEALETWDISIFQYLMPEVLRVIEMIDDRFRKDLQARGVIHEQINHMAPLGDGKVRMAWLSCYGSSSINGVAALHTDILKRDTLKDWYEIWPERFNNKTNGVTPRRWLRTCNPELATLITDCLGSEDWVSDLDQLEDLLKFKDDAKVLERFGEVKREKKVQLAEVVKQRMGIDIDPDAVFDIQIKRLHEYKRQLMNGLYILDLYYRLKDDPMMECPKRVFFFGAKAAPGYVRAKAIIKFLNEVARLVNNDPQVNEKIKVIFFENYNVSLAEKLFPAADISEQISTSGMEASGTGNMKFMMNGALTLGTRDGANVEIGEAVGEENIYFFGPEAEDMPATMDFYHPRWQYENIPGLKRVLDSLTDGTLSDDNRGVFQDLKRALLDGSSWDGPDLFYVLGDFDEYRKTRDKMSADYYDDRDEWLEKCWINIAMSGRFSSDQTVKEYAEEIWKIDPIKI